MSDVNPLFVAPTNPGSVADVGGLLVMDYDPTGRVSVSIVNWPILGWNIDAANPINPLPITMGNPLATTPPVTAPIQSPHWAYAISDDTVYVADVWRGTLGEFFSWLATNNGASRVLSGSFGNPLLRNAWHQWARENPSLVAP